MNSPDVDLAVQAMLPLLSCLSSQHHPTAAVMQAAEHDDEGVREESTMSNETLLPRREVERRVGLGRSAIYERIANGTFPRPVKLGASSCWVASEIEAWIQERIAERDAH